MPPRSRVVSSRKPHSQRSRRPSPLFRLSVVAVLGILLTIGVGKVFATAQQFLSSDSSQVEAVYARPQLSPLPSPVETLECEVVVVGGSLGGVAAAAHAMQSGATTCLIELSPWLGGQISSQGVSAIDESNTMLQGEHMSRSWVAFKQRILDQTVGDLPEWTSARGRRVRDMNSCWVGRLCFPPHAGDTAALSLLQDGSKQAPGSRWLTSTAFKGAEFDATGNQITAVYAVRRKPIAPGYLPLGKLSQELASWYSWSDDDTFQKTPIRLQAPAGKRLIVIDATDTGEVVGWAKVPYRLGADARSYLDEKNAPAQDSPACTQAFTYPFVMGVHRDPGKGMSDLALLQPQYSHEEHRNDYNLQGFPMFAGQKSMFNYRRIVSTRRSDPFTVPPVYGDMSLINWNRGNDWPFMDPSLILTPEQLKATDQHQNWMGGISGSALQNGENHALLFALWLLENKTEPSFPLVYLSGHETPMGTQSGLSMMPYIREGRRILGREAYGQTEFMMRESDVRRDQEGRDFGATAIAAVHYALDIHGCRHRNWEESGDANSAPATEEKVRPTQIPLEALIPQEVDNLLIGGKSIAVSHIVNAMTRIHYSEWSIGAAAGATAGWLLKEAPPSLPPADIVPQRRIAALQRYLVKQGLRYEW